MGTSAAAISTTCDRKKRSIDDSPIDDEDNHPDMISPTSYIRKNYPDEHEEITRQKRSNALTKLEELNKLANVRVAQDAKVEPRFFLYWVTSTVTATSTTTTKSLTISISSCTPSGSFSLTLCG